MTTVASIWVVKVKEGGSFRTPDFEKISWVYQNCIEEEDFSRPERVFHVSSCAPSGVCHRPVGNIFQNGKYHTKRICIEMPIQGHERPSCWTWKLRIGKAHKPHVRPLTVIQCHHSEDKWQMEPNLLDCNAEHKKTVRNIHTVLPSTVIFCEPGHDKYLF